MQEREKERKGGREPHKGGELGAEGGHAVNVGGDGVAKARDGHLVGPLIRPAQLPIARLAGCGRGQLGGQVDLLAVVDGELGAGHSISRRSSGAGGANISFPSRE